MMRKLFFVGALLITVFVVVCAQNPAAIKESARSAMEQERYVDAIEYFRDYLELTGNRSAVALDLVEAYYYRGFFIEASEELFFLREQFEKPPFKVLWWEAKVLQAQNRFSQAAEQYKKYWQFADRDELRAIERALLDCESGQVIQAKGQHAFVHNMETSVNSAHDELAPSYLSFEGQEGLIFSRRMDYPKGRQDKYSAFFLPHHLEQPRSIKLGGDAAGLIYTIDPINNQVIMYSGNRWPYGKIEAYSLRDTTHPLNRKSSFESPAKGKYGDTDLFWMSEDCIIFAAQMESGKGGYDLYRSCKTQNGWSRAEPLPGVVNTPWHERSASVHPNGKILFFSSDRPGGLGGFDVYYSKWNGRKWGVPINIGLGVNSLADELFLRWGGDGHTAYLSSNRPGSYGNFDLYQAYFKEAFAEKVSTELEIVKNAGSGGGLEDRKDDLIKRPLFFKDLDAHILPDQYDHLSAIATYLESVPDADIHLICRSRYQGPKKYDLFFSLQKAREVGEVLNDLGISPQRIHISGAGAGDSPVSSKASAEGLYRVDFLLSDMENYVGQQASLSASDYNRRLHQSDFFYLAPDSLFPGLTYSVQVAAFQRIFEGEVLEEFQWPMVKTRLDKKVNFYTVGTFTTYRAAKNLRKRLLASGYKGAFIVAKIDGIRKTRGQLHPLKHKFRDLTSYIYVD
ncbi:MAG: OmpA family protein [Bacteroidetes bacterium]|jgi:outer membrane protein OmpA-like peptidoglycan-associated protein/tetratricopeptide (TPR) repeat protein|nr:OmpA family protein [Bacteroidota bacterium]